MCSTLQDKYTFIMTWNMAMLKARSDLRLTLLCPPQVCPALRGLQATLASTFMSTHQTNSPPQETPVVLGYKRQQYSLPTSS